MSRPGTGDAQRPPRRPRWPFPDVDQDLQQARLIAEEIVLLLALPATATRLPAPGDDERPVGDDPGVPLAMVQRGLMNSAIRLAGIAGRLEYAAKHSDRD